MGTANNVLIGLGFFVILLVVYFQGSKKRPMPTKLNMRATAPAAGNPGQQAPLQGDVPLNIMFNFNGHSFDAYEALGVPAGSSWEEVRTAFEKSISPTQENPSGQDQEFYLTAFNAIKTRQKF